MKKLLIVAVLAAALFVGGYLGATTWLNPRPATQAASAPSAQSTAVAPAPNATIVMPTIVTAEVNKDGIPTKISSLPLTQSQLGKDALSELATMHGAGFDLVNGYRADYSDGTNKATLWVGRAKDAASAQKLADDMANKIGTNNPMFTGLKSLDITNRTIYEVTGQGQLHFFYAVNDKLVWLATDPDYAADGLHSIWGAIK